MSKSILHVFFYISRKEASGYRLPHTIFWGKIGPAGSYDALIGKHLSMSGTPAPQALGCHLRYLFQATWKCLSPGVIDAILAFAIVNIVPRAREESLPAARWWFNLDPYPYEGFLLNKSTMRSWAPSHPTAKASLIFV